VSLTDGTGKGEISLSVYLPSLVLVPQNGFVIAADLGGGEDVRPFDDFQRGLHIALADGLGEAFGGVGGELIGAASDGLSHIASATVQSCLEAEILAEPIVERAAADAGGGCGIAGVFTGQKGV
jgi:hypothetical protein